MIFQINKPAISQGAQANRSGQSAEDVICAVIEKRRYRIQRQAEIGLTIYGHPLKVDVLVLPNDRFPLGLVIESKWQDRNGSVDEKFPYLVLNIKEMVKTPTIIVYGGNGARGGAIEWLKQQKGQNLIEVFSLEEFLSWANRNL